MFAKRIKVIVGALAISLLFTGISFAGPGNSPNQKVSLGPAANGKGVQEKAQSGNAICSANKNQTKAQSGKNTPKPNNAQALKESVKRGSVTGLTLLDESTGSSTSTPLGNVQLRLYELKKTKKGYDRIKTVYAAKSNKDGKYDLKNVKVGSYVLRVWSPVAVPVSESTMSVTVEESATTTVPDIHFLKLGSVTGKVLLDITEEVLSTSDASATTTTVTSTKPLENVHLRLYTQVKAKKGFMLFKTAATARTDSDGNYTFKNVRPGTYIVRVWSPNAVPANEKYIEVTAKVDKTVTVDDIHMKPRPEDVKPITVFKGGKQKR